MLFYGVLIIFQAARASYADILLLPTTATSSKNNAFLQTSMPKLSNLY